MTNTTGRHLRLLSSDELASAEEVEALGLDSTGRFSGPYTRADLARILGGRCSKHRAYDADYCPLCGTAREIGGTR